MMNYDVKDGYRASPVYAMNCSMIGWFSVNVQHITNIIMESITEIRQKKKGVP
jgi:hypothetical protein